MTVSVEEQAWKPRAGRVAFQNGFSGRIWVHEIFKHITETVHSSVSLILSPTRHPASWNAPRPPVAPYAAVTPPSQDP